MSQRILVETVPIIEVRRGLVCFTLCSGSHTWSFCQTPHDAICSHRLYGEAIAELLEMGRVVPLD